MRHVSRERRCFRLVSSGATAASLAVMLTAVFCASARAGTPANWNGGTGLWNDPTRWSVNLSPNNGGGSTYDVNIAQISADVSLNVSATVDTVQNSGTLRLLSGFSLTTVQPGGLTNAGQVLMSHAGTSGLAGAVRNTGFMWMQAGTLELSSSNLQNDGTVWLGDGTATGGPVILRATSDWTWTGNGEIYLNSTALDEAKQPRIEIGAGRKVTNSAPHRIHGGAGLITGQGTLVNQGLIDADVPLRTLKISLGGFENQGNLWARSGNLNVAVDDWHNSGTIRVSNGGLSTFSGTLFTNDSSGVVQSTGGANLAIQQNVMNYGAMSTAGSGRLTFAGNNTLITNLPAGRIDANTGTVRFEGFNSYVQNFGGIRADQGRVEFANGADVFGGNLTAKNNSTVMVQNGTTNLSQVRTSLDSTSSIEAQDLGTGPVALNVGGTLDNAGGRVVARTAGNTAAVNISGRYTGAGGTFLADGGDINVANAQMVQNGALHLDIRDGGDVRFGNVDSTAAQMNVTWSGNGGVLSFDNYRAGTPTDLNLSALTATGTSLSVVNGSSLTGSGLTALTANSTLTVSGGGARFNVPSLTLVPATAVADVAFGGRLVVNSLTSDGEVRLRGGTIDGHLHLNAGSAFTLVNSGANLVTGSLSWTGNREIVLANSTTLGINGPVNVAAGSGFTLSGNSNRLNGTGLITNSGLIRADAVNDQVSNFLDSPINNTAAGILRVSSSNGAKNTYFQLSGNITNAGIMEADGANLYFIGAKVANSGTLRARNNPAGSRMIFLGGAQVTNAGGNTLIDGATSTLEVLQGSKAELGTLTFANGAGGYVSDNGSSLTTSNVVNLAAGSSFSVVNSSQFNGAGVDLSGNLIVQNSAAVNAPVTVRPTGKITANSSVATLNGNVTLQNDGGAGRGRLSIIQNGAVVNGAGTITNAGLIEAGAPNTNNSTYLDSTVINSIGGIIRAFQNNAATNTYLQIRGNVTNSGIMEADGANLYFTGATIQNSGTLRSVQNAAGSALIFLNGTRVTNAGGATTLTGANSSLQVSQASRVELGTLTFADGAGGFVSDFNTALTATNTVPLGATSTFTVANSSQFNAAGVDLAGNLIVQNSAVVNAPVTVRPTGKITANSSVATLNGNVTIQNDGGAGRGRLSLLQNSVVVNGAGTITNAGLIEAGAPNTNNSTYLDSAVVNSIGGIIRAFQNNAATNTYLQIRGNVTNSGIMEADGANLYFTGATVQNNATLRSVQNAAGSALIFLNGTRVTNAGGATTLTGANSSLQVSQGSKAELGALTFADGAGGFLSDLNTVLTATNTVPLGATSTFTVANSSQFNAAGVDLSGNLIVQNSAVVNAPVTVRPTGRITANSSVATLNGNVTIQNDGGAGRGRLSLLQNSVVVNGTGIIANSGLIEAGAVNANNSTYLDKQLTNNPSGIVRAFSNGGATNTYLQFRTTVNNAGVMEADGANLYFTGAAVTNSGTMRTVANAAGSKLIFLGGTTVTNSGGSTSIAGAASTLEVSQGAKVQLGNLSFSGGAGGFVSDLNTSLTAANVVPLGLGSVFTITNSSSFNAPGFDLAGTLFVQNSSNVNAPITVRPTGKITANSSVVGLNGNVTLQNDGAGGLGRLSLVANSAQIVGSGVITNSGLIEGGAFNTNNSVYLDSNVVNTAAGTIRAFQNGAATSTYLQLRGGMTNAGLMEANGGNLYFTPGGGLPQSVVNSGLIRGANNSAVIFTNGARMTDAGGTFRLLTGASGQVVNGGTSVDATTIVDAGASLSVGNSARLGGPSLSVNGQLTVNNSALVDAPTTAAPGARVVADSGPGYFNKSLDLQRNGPDFARLSIVNNSARVGGTGVVTNAGLIEGGAPNNNNTTFLDTNLVNLPGGEVRAYSNNGATSTTFQLDGASIINQGLFSANAATLYVVNTTVDSTGGTWSAGNGGHFVIGGASVTGSNVNATIDGASSSFDLINNAIVGLNTLSLPNGGDFSVNGGATALAVLSPITLGAGSVGTILNSARLTVPSVSLSSGNLALQGGVLTGNVQIGAAGSINATGGATVIDGDVTTVSGSQIVVNNGSPTLVVNGALNNVAGASVVLNTNGTSLSGTGLFTNAGTLQGGGWNNNNTTTLSKTLVNSGQVTASAQNGATGTSFQINAAQVTNSGTMRATGAHLTFTGSTVGNSGLLRAENGFALSFQNSARLNDSGSGSVQIDGDNSLFQLLSSTTATVNSLSLTAGGDVLVQNSTLQVAQPFTVGASSAFSLANGTLNGGAVQVNGIMNANQATVAVPVTVGAAGMLAITSGAVSNFNAPVTVQGSGRLTLLGNSFNMAGGGTVTNSGTIEGDGGANNGTFFLGNSLTNNVGGMVRAFRSAGSNNPTFRLTGTSILNNGTFEADRANFSIGSNGMTNNGTLRTLNGGGFNSDGPVTSSDGSAINFASTTATLRFQSNLTSNGTLDVANNTVQIDGNLSFGPNARFRSAAGSVLLLNGDYQLASTIDNDFSSMNTTVRLTRATVNFEAASQNLGANLAGFGNNFGIGQLLATNSVSTIQLTDLFDNQANGAGNDAVYISTLTLQNPNARLFLNGHTVYYGTFNGQLSQIVLGGGAFTQVAGAGPVPEPAMMVMGLAAGWLVVRRRRPGRGGAR